MKKIKRGPQRTPKIQKLSTAKVGQYIPSGFSMSAISSFKDIKSKHDTDRGNKSMKIICKFLRKHAIKIIFLKK